MPFSRYGHVKRFMVRARGYEPFWAEVWSGLAGVAWGGYSFLSPAPLGDNPAYTDLVAAVPAAVWELGAVAGGLFQLWAVASNKPCARWSGGFAMAAWWGVPIHAILGSAGPASPAVASYAAWIGANCTTVWCLLPRVMAALSKRFGGAGGGTGTP